MKITLRSWASIKNACVKAHYPHEHQKACVLYYTLHSSNKNYEFLLILFIPFSPRCTPLFSHRLRIILPQYSAIFITYGPYYLFQLFYILCRTPTTRRVIEVYGLWKEKENDGHTYTTSFFLIISILQCVLL